MKLGMHLRELWRLRVGLAVSALLALFAAVWSVANIGLSPPRLESRSLEMATAYTQVVVDTPRSTILDLRQGTDDILALKNRALLIGNLMASPPVRAYIGRRAGVPAESLQIITPRTPEQPRALTTPGSEKGPSDLFKPTDEYRLDIQTNPTVPVLDVYAQAPTAKASEELANAAVDGLRDYVDAAARSAETPGEVQVEIRQLGAAKGDVLNEGVRVELLLLVFCLTFALSCLAAVVLARVRRGWRLAAVPGR